MLPDDLAQNGLVVVVQVEDADLAAEMGNILDDLVGLGLPDAEIVFLAAVLFQQLYKSFHGKGIVLGRNAELMPGRGGAQIFFLDEPHLRQHLPCIPQKDIPLRGQHDAPVGAVKDSQTEFLFQFMDGIGQAGLGNIEFLCGLTDGSGIGHSRYIAKLLEGHTVSFRFVFS